MMSRVAGICCTMSSSRSGDSNGTPYFLQIEIIAVTLVREGPADVNLYSVGCLPCPRQLYDSEAETKKAKRNVSQRDSYCEFC